MSVEICQQTAARNKAEVPDFYALYAGDNAFSDDVFTPDDEAFAWSNAQEVYEYSSHLSQIQWKRAKEAYPGHTLFGTNGVTPHDMR